MSMFDQSGLSPETEGVLEGVEATMAEASADYEAIARGEGLPADLPAPGAESAAAFIDAAMQADEEQARRMMAFDQGLAYEQDVKNDIEEKRLEREQAEETSKAAAEAELRAAEAEQAVARAEAAVEESRRERGV